MVKEAKAFMTALANGMRITYIDPRASITACKATRYWQVRPNSDYTLNLAIIHEVLNQKRTTKASLPVLSPVWTTSRVGQGHDARMAGDPHRRSRRANSRLRQRDRRRCAAVIFHPGWMSPRHKQSFYVSRTALILNALMGNIEIPGGFVLGKSPEYYGRKGLNHLTDRVPKVEEPRVDGAGTTRPQWDPEIGMLHQAFAAMETGKPYGIGAYFAYRHDPFTGLPDPEGDKTCAGEAKADRLDRRALLGDGLVRRRHLARNQHSSSAPTSCAR